ncbi:MAG: DDE-type integrase/transposase/recombinase [Dehalococcoidales bacterium]|nr:DDE-type integrase/transposase/recombinase [Dehalococcoidales bacterium]
MSFIRTKEIPRGSGNFYDYEVETIHKGNKVMQKHIRYIGKSGTHVSTGTGMHSHSDATITDTVVLPARSTKPSAPKVSCKFCDSENTRKYGLYKGVQNYYCNDCHTKFIGTDALPHGRVSPSFIASALNEFYGGMSYHDIEQNIEQQTNEDISHTAVMKWVDKYTSDAIRQTKDLHPKVGDTWIADETFVRVDKSKANVENPYSKSRKAKWIVFWDIIDADTRFLLASYVTTTRNTQDARILMEKAQKCAVKTPKVVVTDKLAAYLDGIEQAYGSDAIHRQTSAFEVRNDNNLIERFHGTLKERTKVMRALKNKSTLQRFTDGWLVYYNFFRPHMATDNKPPAMVAGLQYENHNWADVVGYQKEPIVQTLKPTTTESDINA